MSLQLRLSDIALKTRAPVLSKASSRRTSVMISTVPEVYLPGA